MIEQTTPPNIHTKSFREFSYSLDIMHFKSSQDTVYIIPIHGTNLEYLCLKNQNMQNLWRYALITDISVKLFENGNLVLKTLLAGTEILATNCLNQKPYHITAISPFNKHHAFIVDIACLNLIDTSHPYFKLS